MLLGQHWPNFVKFCMCKRWRRT